jgi:glycosyltransferase involved in cell wall biosynthesis
MSKYPRVLFFRYDKYSDVDAYFKPAPAELDCEVEIVSNAKALHALFDANYPILVTYGPNEPEYHEDVKSAVRGRFHKRWVHYKTLPEPKEFSRAVSYCFIDNVISSRESTRPVFSIFTTCYNSYEKINRPLTSLMNQTLLDWEWVVLDDSPTDEHFEFLRKKFAGNKKIRLYRRAENSGNIGNVKNEAASLCRGKYVLELDHDDQIVNDLLQESVDAFTKYPEAGFLYGDFINIYENGNNFFYGDFICLGYGNYYCQKYKNRWVNVYVSPQVNNITMSHLVSLPNHPRIWRRDVLNQLGSYSEFLPINDDQELLMRTLLETKVIKLPKLCYIQYMNEGNNNFSLIRNKEINRIGPNYLVPQFYQKYDVHNKMKAKGAYDDEKFMLHRERCWLREDFVPQYANELYQPHYDTQYCILGTTSLYTNLDKIKDLYKNSRNDFFFIDNHGKKEELFKLLDQNGFHNMKCYSIAGLTKKQMINYFYYIYQSCPNAVILE